MAITIEEFGQKCHDFIAADPGPASRKHICDLVQAVLKDPKFVADHVDPSGPERKILYQDSEFGFVIQHLIFDDRIRGLNDDISNLLNSFGFLTCGPFDRRSR